MKQILSTEEAAHLLFNDKSNGFTYQGAKALAEYIDKTMGDDHEFDAVALRCEYSEYESAVEAATDNDDGWRIQCDCDTNDEDEEEKAALDWLQDHTTVIQFDGGIIVGSF